MTSNANREARVVVIWPDAAELSEFRADPHFAFLTLEQALDQEQYPLFTEALYFWNRILPPRIKKVREISEPMFGAIPQGKPNAEVMARTLQEHLREFRADDAKDPKPQAETTPQINPEVQPPSRPPQSVVIRLPIRRCRHS